MEKLNKMTLKQVFRAWHSGWDRMTAGGGCQFGVDARTCPSFAAWNERMEKAVRNHPENQRD